MSNLTTPSQHIAGVILDGVQRRIIPLTHTELMTIRHECERMRQKRTDRRCTKKWRDLDKYKAQHIGGARGAVLGLWGLVLVVIAWVRG